jgi:hypothetical protein
MKTWTIAAIAAVFFVAVLGVALVVPGLYSPNASAATSPKPCIQTAYYNGQKYCFSVERPVTNASQALIASSQVMYVVTYPQLNSQCSGNLSSCKQQTLPSGYMPQCDPCVEEAPFVYHDHILGGLPTTGDNGSWVIVVVAYAPSFSNQPKFSPFTNSLALTAAESTGDFAHINANGPNPYEIHTRNVLVFSVTPVA